jgi:hypothetical protein
LQSTVIAIPVYDQISLPKLWPFLWDRDLVRLVYLGPDIGFCPDQFNETAENAEGIVIDLEMDIN